MLQSFDLSRFEEEPILGIIRGITFKALKGVMDAVVLAGLRYLEITLNTENAPELIRSIVLDYDLFVGAGTVLNRADAQKAYDAGAMFLVGPTFNQEVAAFSREKKMAYFPGAFTPTEIENAWNAGAAMVKVFPASRLGPDYFKEIRGPFPEIKLMAVGGVHSQNIHQYLTAGASGLAVGSSVFTHSRMENKEFSAIRVDIEQFLLAVRRFYTKIECN